MPTHDWAGFARSLGLQAATVTAPAELTSTLAAAAAAQTPYLLDVRCDRAFATPVTPYCQAKQEWVDND